MTAGLIRQREGVKLIGKVCKLLTFNSFTAQQCECSLWWICLGFFVAAKYMVLLIINKFDFKSCDTHFLLEIFCHTHKSHKKI